MTLEEYVWMLETQVDPELVRQIQDWSMDTKLYMYLHNIQLEHMAEFKEMLLQMKNSVKHNNDFPKFNIKRNSAVE